MRPFLFFICFSFIVTVLQAQPFHPKFFCFEDAFLKNHTDDPEFQTELVKELGFDGMELMGLDRMDERLAALDQQNLQLFMVYIRVDLEKPQPYDPRLFNFIQEVELIEPKNCVLNL